MKNRHWKTREDPLAAVWESELVPLLENEPTLSGITLRDYLDEKYPGQYPETRLRTLQRRVKHWLATRNLGPIIWVNLGTVYLFQFNRFSSWCFN
jgi:hypothetical protein